MGTAMRGAPRLRPERRGAEIAWRHATWSRWLGWTALSALGVIGGHELFDALAPRIADGGAGEVAAGLVATVGAFAIRARFRSEWWSFWPPAALVLLLVAITVWLAMEDFAGGGWAWFLFFSIPLLSVGTVLSVFAFAGVWWGNRRREPDPAPPGDDGH
jgi:hypothetical protein